MDRQLPWRLSPGVSVSQLGVKDFDFFQCLVMILPQVHLRKPCYDFYFIDPRQIKGLSRNGPRVAPRSRTGPTFSWTRTLCSSDGRCVQRAGT